MRASTNGLTLYATSRMACGCGSGTPSGWSSRTFPPWRSTATAVRWTPWPHDTMLAAQGMASYGHVDEAGAVAAGMREAAAHFGNTLPELFGGFSRTDLPVPVKYHHAGSPQAWVGPLPGVPVPLAAKSKNKNIWCRWPAASISAPGG